MPVSVDELRKQAQRDALRLEVQQELERSANLDREKWLRVSRQAPRDELIRALDEKMEKRVYEILAERLPAATVISMTHRPAVAQYHKRCWKLVTSSAGRTSLQTT